MVTEERVCREGRVVGGDRSCEGPHGALSLMRLRRRGERSSGTRRGESRRRIVSVHYYCAVSVPDFRHYTLNLPDSVRLLFCRYNRSLSVRCNTETAALTAQTVCWLVIPEPKHSRFLSWLIGYCGINDTKYCGCFGAKFFDKQSMSIDCNNISACHEHHRKDSKAKPAIIVRFVNRKSKIELSRQTSGNCQSLLQGLFLSIMEDMEGEDFGELGSSDFVSSNSHVHENYENLNLKTFDFTEHKLYEMENDIDPENNFYNDMNCTFEYYPVEIIRFNGRSLYSNFTKIKDYLKQFTMLLYRRLGPELRRKQMLHLRTTSYLLSTK
ncbi:hypothetical protein F2P81_013269 [Scophthalmus maximus]|uniref:Uncharacterized protein n=1 Tax=Scophthalmus maximus TaxID=52904 RepID=A0A6A4SWX7_SCOMX|nr:hypothetical protein F2P81_013269 [Scophthalmus maximus]